MTIRTLLPIQVTLCVLLFCLAAWSATYYVCSVGNDSNPGTQSRPWRTLSRVNSAKLVAGDHVLLRGGETFDGNIELDDRLGTNLRQPIVIGSYSQGQATIHAGAGTGIMVRNIGGIVIRDLNLIGSGASANRGFGVEVVNERGTERLDSVWLDHLDVSGFRWVGIYVGGVPNLPGIQRTAHGRYGFQNVRISRCAAHGNLYYGILVSGPWTQLHWGYANANVTISDCVAHDNPGDPGYKENHSGNGILLDDSAGGLIEHSTAYHNGAANGSQQGGPVGIWTDESDRVVIQFCESYDNRTGGAADGGGFDLDGGVTNSVMQYNYSHGNDGAGYLVWNYGGAVHPLAHNVIRYNISENDGRKHHYGGVFIGTFGTPVEDVEVYNNTIFMKPSVKGRPIEVWVGGGQANTGIRFRNNLLISDSSVPLAEIEPNQRDVMFQGNDYWTRQGNFIILDRGKTYHSLETWRTAVGQEQLDGKATGLSVAPLLTRMDEGETIAGKASLYRLAGYRLLPDSPLIDAGLDLGAAFGLDVGTQDFWGTPIPQGESFDIGACEAPGR